MSTQIQKTHEIYNIVKVIEPISASQHPAGVAGIQENRKVELQVVIDSVNKSISIYAPNHNIGGNYHNPKQLTFKDSDPEVVRVMGEILIAAANMAQGKYQTDQTGSPIYAPQDNKGICYPAEQR